jgi:ABC-type transporter Mla maintaining outer membrane lipid asymmetry ATPase subunit MlaF
MQKRLALARAIVTRPELVLFDEPTAGLDPVRRNAVFTMIAKYQRQFGFTALIVTHDVPEALVAADRVALLDTGRMVFQGSPGEFIASEEAMVIQFRDSEKEEVKPFKRKTHEAKAVGISRWRLCFAGAGGGALLDREAWGGVAFGE